jgi:hypothetical protein
MVTINSVIARVDAVKINTYTAEEKARWIIELEGRIFREILRCFGEYPVSEYPRDGDRELIVSSPYDVVYDYYLFSMIDFHNRETENYENSFAIFNARYNDFATDWQRRNRPPDGGTIDTMGWANPSGNNNEGLTVDEKITNHDSEKGSHPYILQMMKQRYDAMYLRIEQYKALVDNTATDDDIERLIAKHNRSQYAHQDLFNEVQTTIDEHTSATNNPHEVTKAQVGLDKVDNTPDNEKYVAYASNAGYALNAELDVQGNSIHETYATKDEVRKVDLSGYYTKTESDGKFVGNDVYNADLGYLDGAISVNSDRIDQLAEDVGKIDTALDELHSYAQNLVGGDA